MGWLETERDFQDKGEDIGGAAYRNKVHGSSLWENSVFPSCWYRAKGAVLYTHLVKGAGKY